jgi:hypothetical protein
MLASLIAGTGCRGDPEALKPAVESLEFEKAKVEMKIGERLAVKVEVKPVEARRHHPVTYAVSAEGIVAVSEESSDGCVLTAESGGIVVVIAKAGDYTAYLEVAIDQENFVQVPYIMIPAQVIEVGEGSRKSVQVSLFNGSAVDNQQFDWVAEPGKDNISISPVGNTVVVQGERRGSQKIIVKHARSEYAAEILVFVLGVEEKVKYITTGQNVITMKAGGVNAQFSAVLMNGGEADAAGFTFKVIEDSPCVSILAANNTCNVMAHRRGTAVIRVSHPLAEYPLDVRVIALEGEEAYIELDKTFLMLDIGRGEFVRAEMKGSYRESWNGDFTYALRGDTGCVEVIQTNFSFYVTAVKSGSCIMEIANKNMEYGREVLIVARDPSMVPPDEYYITTSQNVMQLEIGQEFAAELNIQLINGNEGDKASFEWTVEDGRIAEVEALDLPLGKGVNYLARSTVNSVSNTLALVTPKKVGTTKIIIAHPKSAAVATVICKVYPRGTFAGVPFIIDNPAGGLIKVDTGFPDVKVKLEMKSGSENDVGDLEWAVKNADIAEVQDLKRLENEIHGKGKGVTKLAVGNMNLKYPYEATVMVGTADELALMSVLYVDQAHQTAAVGQSVSLPIKNSNGENNALANSDQYFAEGYDKGVVAATMIKNRLLLQGLAEGKTTVTVGNRMSGGITPVDVAVTVVADEINIDQPYTLNGPNFVGLNYGQETTVRVGLTDATPVEKDRIRWTSGNAQIVKVTGNGEEARLTAGSTLGQTNVTVSHGKSVNEKVIVAYVVPPGTDPEKVVVLGIEKDHWLMKPGEEVMMQLISNADESADKNINDITWGGYDVGVVSVDYNGGRALVAAKGPGSTVITVTHPKKAIDLKIYMSVSNAEQLAKEITLPSIVEMIIGENKVITAVAKGLSPGEINNIMWSIDDSSVAGITGEGADFKGGKLYVQGKGRGQAWLTARQDDMGYVKKILVVCARTYEELMNTFVMASEESYYRLKAGESRNINLIFGSAGFPESEKPFITWSDEGNKIVKIYADGDHAKIEAAGLGISAVTVNHSLVLKPVTITFETYNEVPGPVQYVLSGNTLMMGLVVKKPADSEGGDNTKNLTVGISPSGPSYGQISAADEEPGKGIFEFTQAGNAFRITGRAKGQSYLRISHPQAPEDLRVLIYAADSKDELDAMFPIALSKPNYLLTIGGESQYIRITTPPDTAPGYADKIKNVSWTLDNARPIDYVISADKKEARIDGKNTGNCVFDIKYNGQTAERAYVSVKSKTAMDMRKKIATENIIGLNLGEANRKTGIGSNLTPDEIAELEWRVANPAIVSIAPIIGDKGSQYLTAVSPGETEVVVSFGQIERHIKVYVNAAPGQYKAVNLDNRYYQLRRNEEMTLTAFHAALSASSDDRWVFYPASMPFDNKVIEIETIGKDSARIKGINEGIATIVLYNAECLTDVTFMVEVSDTAPLVEAVKDDWYMTAVKTVYALDPAKVMETARIAVNGVRFPAEELAKIEWRVVSEEIGGIKKELGEGDNGTLLDLYNRKGSGTDVAPKNKAGTAVLRAYHPRSVNSMDITVICDAAAVQANPVPHIVVDKEIVKLQLNESDDITARIEDITGGYDIAQFEAESDNPQRVQVSRTGNRITAKGLQFGQALVTISHPKSEIKKKIIVMVAAGDNALVYLTTKQNFVVLEKNNYQLVEVELAGYADVNSRNYIWSTDDHDIISVNDSGKSAVITAKDAARTAKITVRHVLCMEYPLFIYVRVTEKASGPPVYITTNNNIVSVKEGNSLQIRANLANAGAYELSNLEWKTADAGLIELNASGGTALVKGLRAGTGAVHVSHKQGLSLNQVTVLVVVEPLEPNNGIYITTDTLLVEMGTAEGQRKITARLVGGNAEDIYGFQWSVSNYVSVIKQGASGVSHQVIDITYNADVCYVSPKRNASLGYIEGEAVITISHPKTNYKLDVKVIVSDQTDIEFAQNYVTMDQYSQVMIPVKAPANGLLQYACTNSKVAQVSGTNSACVIDGLTEGTVVITAYNMSGTKSSEIVVRVNAVDLNDYFWLRTASSIVLMTAGQNKVTVNVDVVNTKTGVKDAELTGKLRWKIRESDQSKGVVRLNGFSDGAMVMQDDRVDFYPGTPGTAEVVVGFFDLADPVLEKHPALKGVTKTVYVKVDVADYLFVLSDVVIRMGEGSARDGIWARVDGVGTVDYRWDKDVKWASDDIGIVAVVPPPRHEETEGDPNYKAAQSNVTFQAGKPGSAMVKAWYNGSYQVISVVVEADSYVRANMSNISVMPDISDYFIITSNPNNEKISVTADSNMSLVIAGRARVSANDDPRDRNNPNNGGPWQAYSNLSNFEAGEHGFIFRVTGAEYEGATSFLFEMKGTGRKTQVTVINVKNYYIKWKEKAQMRFAPNGNSVQNVKWDTTSNSGKNNLRAYYDISPADDYLVWEDNDYGFDLFVGEDGDGKYIGFKPKQGEQHFNPGYRNVRFYSKKFPETNHIDLPVYIYYEKVDVEWKLNKGATVNTSTFTVFDDVNYAVTVANKEQIVIDMITPETDKPNSGVYIASCVLKSGSLVTAGRESGSQPRNFYVRNDNTVYSNNTGKVLKSVSYYGLLEVIYRYYNGKTGGDNTEFKRNVLVYLADWSN